uniref:Uncharacterized protein n=1 Tax=Arundo donax TaxID=35708 RepID=A0A0A9EQW5_ARUDO
MESYNKRMVQHPVKTQDRSSVLQRCKNKQQIPPVSIQQSSGSGLTGLQMSSLLCSEMLPRPEWRPPSTAASRCHS